MTHAERMGAIRWATQRAADTGTQISANQTDAATLALAARIVEQAGEFDAHEQGCQAASGPGGDMKAHVLKRLEILGRLHTLLTQWNAETKE